MYGRPSGPVYTPELIKHPWKRSGKRVVVIPNDDSFCKDLVGREGVAVGPNGPGRQLVYFDNYIDLNIEEKFLAPIPQGEHLFITRNRSG
ncbi:MAG: hypothetical protein Tp138OMZ00d2C19078261_28 [Prokaryotic dsDNA virus sp.]|jgi:hypothetical protein|nr:MAG: hypothetical protein Tp138OMZ00d2C19078261_28 [Prokaryotic dsDNA virus sp.]|tara:strand:- start:20985 stop:21254 length:270 start_codon:yes stop_codon:yes gene_type:complete